MLDPIPIAFSILYVLGAILHYLHVMSLMQLTDNLDNVDIRKVYWRSAVWPTTVISYILGITFLSDEDY